MNLKVGDKVKCVGGFGDFVPNRYYEITKIVGMWIYFEHNSAGWNYAYFEKHKPKMKKTTKQTGLRMYFFVMYNLSGIQKGIQAGHAALEYYQTFGKNKVYQDFINHHKTFILLDGGGSEDMKQRAEDLTRFGVDYDGFFEPDLNNSLSALAFIVPEEIYGMDSGFFDYAKANPEFMDRDTEFAMYLKGFRLASN